jgi:hypothetical protein
MLRLCVLLYYDYFLTSAATHGYTASIYEYIQHINDTLLKNYSSDF